MSTNDSQGHILEEIDIIANNKINVSRGNF